MLNILQICTSRSWGGMEMHVGFLARQLARRGHRVTTVCAPETPLAQDLRESGFEPGLFNLSGYFHPRSIVRFAKWLEARPVEIIHAHYSRDLWTIVPAMSYSKVGRNVPLLLTKHIGTGKPKRDVLHRWLYRRVDYLIAISEVIRQNLIATHPISSEKVGVIHHGVDLEQFPLAKISDRSLRQALGFSHDEVVVGMVGRLQISKGYLEFLEMAARLQRIQPKTKFLIVGEATRGEPRDAEVILQKCEALHLNEKVKFLGFRKDVPLVLAAMDVFVFPSHAEAFGLALLEAMAAGKAVVASNNDGVLDIVHDGQTGILVPPKDVTALTEACLRLVEDENLRRQMGDAGRSAVCARFSVQQMLEQLESLYWHLQSQSGVANAANKKVYAARVN